MVRSLGSALRGFILLACSSIGFTLLLMMWAMGSSNKSVPKQHFLPKSNEDIPHVGSKITIPLKYMENIANISRHDFNYILNPSSGLLCQRQEKIEANGRKSSGRILILYMVHSAADHFQHRKTIRETWGAFGKRLTKLVFLLGDPQNETLQLKLNEESDLFNDLVQEDFYETYRNITLKNISGLKWASKFCSRAEYIVKADDDVFINTPLLVKSLISSKVPKKQLILCKIHYFKNVPRSGKYGISPDIYEPSSWPEFCFGGCWITSRDVTASFYEVSLQTRQIYLDDVYVTGILRTKLGLNLSYLSRAYNMFCHARGNYTLVRQMWKFQQNDHKKGDHFIKTWSTCFH